MPTAKPKTRGPVARVVYVDEDRLRELIAEGIGVAFDRVGIDTSSPLKMQADMAYLRTWRELVQKSGMRAFMSVVAVIAVGVFGAFAIGMGMPLKVLALFGIVSR